MRIGVIGTGFMGSNLTRCLARKGIEVGVFNRTRERAVELSRETGVVVYDSPLELLRDFRVVVVFLSDDYAVRSIALSVSKGPGFGGDVFFVNASTVTPMTSIEVWGILESSGVVYVEAPVYGSVDEARECRLISIISCRRDVFEEISRYVREYSVDLFYAGEPPRAMVLKLALNNIGLAIPVLLAESLMLLRAWDSSIDLFHEVSKKTWFGEVVERYWRRIFEDKSPRFKLSMAAKDYSYISSALRARNLQSILSDAITSLLNGAVMGGFGDRDYPQVARYYYGVLDKNRS